MDYGSSWENAWAEHAEVWKDTYDGQPLESVTQMNEEAGPVQIMSGDLRKLAEHERFTTGCVYQDEFSEDEQGYRDFWKAEEPEQGISIKDRPPGIPTMDVLWRYEGKRIYRPFDFDDSLIDEATMSWSADWWHHWSDEQILWEYSENGRDFTPENNSRFRFGGAYWPCEVIRGDVDGTYIVRIFPSKVPGIASPKWAEEGYPRFLTSYPRGSIRYFTKAFAGDVHLAMAFRHHIEIKEEIFPAHWKDREGSEDLETSSSSSL